jgi:thiosulfate/3-mercaptopyruvate sulfurtransferase
MQHDTLITATELQALLAAGKPLVLLDCGFDLGDAAAGERAYATGHLPGAHYAHLDRDLSSPKTGRNGRHPLPTREAMSRMAATWGVAPGVQVVTYDDQGLPYAARAWWLLRWLGHSAVAVLDGGRAAWLAAGGVLSTAPPVAANGAGHASYPASPTPAMPSITADDLLGQLGALKSGALKLLDARAGERFRGEVEPLDPVAGHIPGHPALLMTTLLLMAASNLRTSCAASGARRHRCQQRAAVWIGRHRLPQPAGHGARWPGFEHAVRRQLERMVQ